MVVLIAALFIYLYGNNKPEFKKYDGKAKKYRRPILPGYNGHWASYFGKKLKIQINRDAVQPAVSFYSLKTTGIDGSDISFEKFKGKKVLLVNTASDCGYTAQYDDLQKLYDRYKDKLVVIGFPANDFKEQEKGTDAEIAQFCKANYRVNFPLATKSSVIKTPQQNKVFEWLSHKSSNGWNDQQPTWNFSKYLVNEQGMLMDYFDPSVSPLSNEVIMAISQ